MADASPRNAGVSPAETPQTAAGETSAVPGVVIPQPLPWYNRIAAFLIYGLVQLVSLTLRIRWAAGTRFEQLPPDQPVIFCIWHNRLALCLAAYASYVGQLKRAHRMAAMVSASKDGGLLARVLELFGVQPVRGSTSRRGPQALRELTTWAERGYDLAITPDGPRGPMYVVQSGVVSLAQLTGLPILPASWQVQWKIRVKSWDAFQIPLPFSRCTISLGEPISVPREASDEEREAARQQLEQQLSRITVD